MSLILSKLLWRLYLFILIASLLLLLLSSYFLWKSIVQESKTELVYANRIVSNSLFSLLNKDESLFRLTGQRLLELGSLNNNPKSVKLLDEILLNNPEFTGIVITTPKGDVILTTSNLVKDNFTNLLQKKETKDSFTNALNSDSLVMGRTYFFEQVNDWILPIRLRILDKNNTIKAVFNSGIKTNAENSPWRNTNPEDAIRISIIDKNLYFQFASFINPENLSQFYKTPIDDEFIKAFSKKLHNQTGFTLKDFTASDQEIAHVEYQAPSGEDLIGVFSFHKEHSHYIFTTILKSELLKKLILPMTWLTLLVIGFNSVLLIFFKYLNKVQYKSKTDLLYQSHHDLLTGLPNLRFLFQKYKSWRLKNNDSYSIMFIDLDNFKNINDIHGHLIGDQVLISMASRINLFFKNGLCVRQGGDEFVVLLPNKNINDTVTACQQFLIGLKKPIIIDEFNFSVRASIGIAHSPTDGNAFESLLRKSDIAMYEAKRKKSEIHVFSKNLNSKNNRIAMISKELNTAIINNEFSLVFQPQFEMETNRVAGIEVLLRWDNEALKDVPPSEFIPIAESTGAILDIGRYIFEKTFLEFQDVCNQYLKNNTNFNENNLFKVSVNVSILQLSQEGFLDHLLSLFKKFDCKKAKLTLEITETLVIANIDKISLILDEIKKAGIDISLDDFGTGYSSLSYLSNLPINELKIDKSFVHGMITKKNDLALVHSITNLASSLNLKVVAEGVETQEQLNLLKKYNCKYVQGYYYSKPLTKSKLLHFLKNEKISGQLNLY